MTFILFILIVVAIMFNMESSKALFIAELPKAILKEFYKISVNIVMIIYLYTTLYG